MGLDDFVLDGGRATPESARRVIRLEGDDVRAELQGIAHDLRGTAWSTEGLLRLLRDTWDQRSESERRRILQLALTQARTLQALSPRLERIYREPTSTSEGVPAAVDLTSRS